MRRLNYNKILVYTGHISFLILTFLSVLFYMERIVFSDTVFQFFKIVNFEKFNIEAGRYSTFLTQIPLLLAIKANANLKSLMLIYSTSFIVLYYLIFILSTYTLKNITAGITIGFIFLLCIKQSFFHTSTETHQGLVYTAFLFSILYYEPKNRLKLLRYFLIFIAVALSFYSHPVTLFTVLFVIGYYLVDKMAFRDTGAYLAVFMVIILAIIKLLTTKESSYEGNFFSEFLNASAYFSNLGDLYSTNFFTDRIWGLYFWVWLFFAISLTGILWQKQYIKFFFVILATVLFLFLTLITYNKGDSNIMMERAFMPLSVFVMLPFMNDVVLKANKIIKPILIAIVLIALFASVRRISMEGSRFKARFQYVESIIDKTKDYDSKKFLLKRSKETTDNFLFWTAPFTMMVVSSIDGPGATKNIFLYDGLSDYERYLSSNTNIFLGAPFWLEWDIGSLNNQYFILDDEPYQLLE